MGKRPTRSESKGRKYPKSPSQASPPKSPVRRMPLLYRSPGGSTPYKNTRPSSSVQREITGDAEKHDYNKVPEYVDLVYNRGEGAKSIQIMTKKIDVWISEQLDRNVNQDIIQATLEKRNQWAGTNYNLDEWKQLQKQRDQQSEEESKGEGICEKFTCTTQLRL